MHFFVSLLVVGKAHGRLIIMLQGLAGQTHTSLAGKSSPWLDCILTCVTHLPAMHFGASVFWGLM